MLLLAKRHMLECPNEAPLQLRLTGDSSCISPKYCGVDGRERCMQLLLHLRKAACGYLGTVLSTSSFTSTHTAHLIPSSMAETIIDNVGVNVPAQDLNDPQVAATFNYMDRYSEERDLRLGTSVRQYIDPSKSEKYKHFLEDPWVEKGTPINCPVKADGHVKALVV